MMMKYIGVIVVALSIDAFEALLAVALAAIGFGLTASVGWIPFVGTAAAGAIDFVGIILGIVIDFSISAVFGSGLIFLLIMTGIMTWKQFLSFGSMPFILAKYIPFINVLPFYTALTVREIMRKEAADGKSRGVSGQILRFALAGASPANALAQATRQMSPGIANAIGQNRPALETNAEKRGESPTRPPTLPLTDIRAPQAMDANKKYV